VKINYIKYFFIIISELIPKFEGGNLVIKSFSEKMLLSEPVYSFPIDCNGVNWRLKVYPNGNGIVRDRYLSVFLELTSGPPGGSRLITLYIYIFFLLFHYKIKCTRISPFGVV